MKQFIVDRHTTPNTPTLEQVPTEKIPVYEDMAAAAADIANLAENQIIATHDTGSELSAPVDVVQSGNMHAVTSNAVARETKTVVVGTETDRAFYYKIGRIVFIQVLKEALTGSSGASIHTIPEGFRPLFNDTRLILVNNSTDTPIGQCAVYTNGDVKAWIGGGGSFDSRDYIFFGSYIAQ